jgi:radical SAM superfamily enzyme YgiQ (UPF0313 family)
MRNTILLYSPPPVLDKPSTRAPLALLAVAGPLTAAGYRVYIMPRDPSLHEAIINSLSGDILAYGLSVMTGPQIKLAMRSTGVLKSVLPKTPVIWGGWHPTIFPEQVAKAAGVDFAVAGPGEDALLNLIKCLAEGISTKGVDGLVFEKAGKMINHGIAPMGDINMYPSLDYGLLDMGKYVFSDEISPRTINYVSSRGCPKNCASCAQSMVSLGKWRAYKPERMVREALRLRDTFGVEGILFDDANFFVDEDRACGFAAGMVNSKAGLSWGMPTGRLEDVVEFGDSLWDVLRISGLKSIFVGLEPRCGAVGRDDADIYGRLSEDVLGLAKTLIRHNIELKMSVLVGFPPGGAYKWTFKEEIAGAARLAEAALAAGPGVSPSLSMYFPYPHVPLYDLALKAGLKPPANLEEWGAWEATGNEMPWVPSGAAGIIDTMNKGYAGR